MNLELVQTISKQSPTAEAFFDYAASRDRNVRDGISSIQSLRNQMSKDGFHPVTKDLRQMFAELEEAGIGELKGDKFKWNVSIKLVGKPSVKQPSPKIGVIAKPTNPVQMKNTSIFFGDKKEIHIQFTNNLTQEDLVTALEKVLKECLK